jgi:hypothetical protein
MDYRGPGFLDVVFKLNPIGGQFSAKKERVAEALRKFAENL